jgi:hypothetical protein
VQWVGSTSGRLARPLQMSPPPLLLPALLLLLLSPPLVKALDNGVGLTPAMGYNTWDDFRCGGINATNLMKVADAMVAQKLPELGYKVQKTLSLPASVACPVWAAAFHQTK